MKFKVYVTVEGLERVALNLPLYSWHINTVQENNDIGQAEGSYLLHEFDALLPLAVDCIQPVLAKLAEQEQEIQAEAYREVMELKQRRENLLSLTYIPASGVEAPGESEL